MVDNVRDTNRDASGLNSMWFSPKGFLEVVRVLRALVDHEGLLLSTLKYL